MGKESQKSRSSSAKAVNNYREVLSLISIEVLVRKSSDGQESLSLKRLDRIIQCYKCAIRFLL